MKYSREEISVREANEDGDDHGQRRPGEELVIEPSTAQDARGKSNRCCGSRHSGLLDTPGERGL
jgi:hypothetical protein